MKIIVAESAGFCWGVRRAMDRTLALADEPTGTQLVTLGPLIHNNQVTDYLAQRGVRQVDDPSNLKPGDSVIIRAHGTTPAMLKQLRDRGATICNATCPKVGRIQGIVQKHARHGYTIFIAGDEGHAEVLSVNGYAGNQAVILGSPNEATQVPFFEKGLLVSQTTFNRETLNAIAGVLKTRGRELQVVDTICDSTGRRQDEVRRIAPQVDAMVIVGGKHSANTTRLAQIAKESCERVYHVETETELDDIDLDGISSIGVSAGASTPNWMLNAVLHSLRFQSGNRSFAFQCFGWLFHFHLYRSLAAAALTAGMMQLAGLSVRVDMILVSFLYLFSISNANRLVSLSTIRYSDPARFHFLRTHRGLLATAVVIAVVGMVSLTWNWPIPSRWLLMVAVILGLLYRVRIPFRQRNVRIFDLPGSKNVLHAAAWTLVMVVIPFLNCRVTDPSTWAAAVLTSFALVFSGTVLFDIRDMQGDRFSGKETLPTLIGRGAAARWTAVFTAFALLASTLIAVTGHIPCLAVLSLLLVAYILLLFRFIGRRRHIPASGWFEVLVDGLAMIPFLVGFGCRIIL